METTYMFIGRWTDKENVVHTYNGIYLAMKKNEIIPFAATWIGLEIILLVSEVDQKQTNIMMSYMWNLNHGTNEFIYKTESCSET